MEYYTTVNGYVTWIDLKHNVAWEKQVANGTSSVLPMKNKFVRHKKALDTVFGYTV